MALPAHLLEQLPTGVSSGLRAEAHPRGLSLDGGELDGVLPDGGLPRSGVVELAVSGAAAQATHLALAACRAAQVEARQRGGETAWCAFVDPSRSLHAPGVASLGVTLERLLVVQPSLEALSRVAVRLAQSQAFAVIVVDLMGMPGASLDVALGTWPRVIRRLSLASERSLVVLITEQNARRPLPLPVALRIEVARPSLHELQVRVGKERRGRVGGPRRVHFDPQARRPQPVRPQPVESVPSSPEVGVRAVANGTGSHSEGPQSAPQLSLVGG